MYGERCSYIVDDDYIRETEKAVGLPVSRRGSDVRVGTIWFPKSQVQLVPMGYHRVKVTISQWIIDRKRESGELLRSLDIMTTF